MAQMAMDGSVVGIAAYLDSTPRVALHGSIKKTAADFIVQEITLDGRVLQLSGNDDGGAAQRLPTQSERDAVAQAMEEARQNSAKQRSKERLVLDEPAHGWREEMRRLLSADRITQIERVVADSGDANSENAVALLEAPTEFRDRVFLQVCIQHCFPSVDCRLRKSTLATGSVSVDYVSTGDADASEIAPEVYEIEVVQDGLYKKFRKNGVSDENACKLLVFVRKGAADPGAAQGVELAHEDTRDARTALHRQISTATSLLKTRTDTRDGTQRIVVFFSPQNQKKRKRLDAPPVPLVKFVLRKTNMEHFSCIERLARRLKRPVSAFAYAGTKDKVATTFQHVTVQGVEPSQVLALNQDETSDRNTSNSGVRIGHVEYAAAPMSLGALTGNRFSINVRGLPSDLSDDELRSRMDQVKQHGFINYFGFQRVGLPSSVVRPHQIGELLVAEKWEDAIQKIFTPSAHDPPECKAAKAAYLANSDDVDAALKLIPPNSMQTERAVLSGLKRFGSHAHEMAIRNIPFARRIMYLHAYQSVLFNSLASHRIQRYGATQVVEGDLVRDPNGDGTVVVATAEKAAQLNKELEDPLACVVLPLPGSNVLYPSNDGAEHLKTLLETHGTRATLETSSQLKGAYRALVERPRDVEWQRPQDADATAVTLKFSLSSGSFATMCLREILHIDL